MPSRGSLCFYQVEPGPFFSILLQSEDYPTPFFYLLPETDFTGVADPIRIILPVFALALPLFTLGIVLTVKGSAARVPIYSCVLFFVPFVNLCFFLLSILPQDSVPQTPKRQKGASWLDRFLPQGQVACAALWPAFPRASAHCSSSSAY